jgi:plastocyanin
MTQQRCSIAVYIVLLAMLPGVSAHAAELGVRISNARGAPVADAVVSVTARGAAAAPAREPPATHIIDQKDETFVPYVEIFRPGDSVVFRNSDQTRHHVYSFAPARQFEFVLTSGQSSTPLRLEQTGVVAVGCNIHDRMITYLYIGDAPWMTRSAADGYAVLALPPGDYEVSVWHPQLRPGQTPPQQTLHVAAAGEAHELAFKLALLPDPRQHADRERVDY